MSTTPTVQAMDPAPPWHAEAQRTGAGLRTPIDGDAVLTTRYRLGDDLHHLASLYTPDTLAVCVVALQWACASATG